MLVFLGLFGLICVWKGMRCAVCLLPSLLVLFLLPPWLAEQSPEPPRQYYGDLLDPFVSFFAGGLSLLKASLATALAAALAVALAFLLGKAVLTAAQRIWGPFKPPPLAAPSRLFGMALLCCAIFLGTSGEVRENSAQSLRSRHDKESAHVVPDFLAGKITAEALAEAFSQWPMLCGKTYAQRIDALTAGDDPQRAGLFVRILAERCATESEAYRDFVDSRKRSGSIAGLKTLLNAGALDALPVFQDVVGYLDRSGNLDELMLIFRHCHAQARMGSRNNAALLENFFYLAGDNRELLGRAAAIAGSDPSRYFSELGIEGVSHSLLTQAALKLDADLLRAVLALGFTRENTRFGSVLFDFARAKAGPAVISKLLAAGVDVNALNQDGQTALRCLLQNYRPGLTRPEQDREKIDAIMDIFFSLSEPAHYRTTAGDTLLHKACRSSAAKSSEVAQLLLAAGADPDLAGEGVTPPSALAREKGWEDISRQFAGHGGKLNPAAPRRAAKPEQPVKPGSAGRDILPSARTEKSGGSVKPVDAPRNHPQTGRAEESPRPVKPGDARRALTGSL